MSLRMSLTYLLLFLCISLHACKARNLGTFDKKLEKKPYFFSKNNEKNGFDFSASALVPSEKSLISVSWPVPYKKHSEENPGFSLDYTPPLTFPPSHNSDGTENGFEALKNK